MGKIRFFADPTSTVMKTFTVTDPDGELDPVTGEVLAEEHWLELRTELSDREWSDIEMGIAPRATAGGELVLDLSGASFRQLAIWIKGWSLTGNMGGKTRPNEEQLGLLRPDLAKVIRSIIEAHVAEMQKKREIEGNPTGPSGGSLVTTATLNEPSGDGDSETPEATSPTRNRPGRGAA